MVREKKRQRGRRVNERDRTVWGCTYFCVEIGIALKLLPCVFELAEDCPDIPFCSQTEKEYEYVSWRALSAHRQRKENEHVSQYVSRQYGENDEEIVPLRRIKPESFLLADRNPNSPSIPIRAQHFMQTNTNTNRA